MAEGVVRLSDPEVEQCLAELEELLGRIETMAGGDGEAARDAVTALAAVYGEALARSIAVAGDQALQRLRADPLLSHLMALHGLHPVPAPRLVARAAPSPVSAFIPLGGLRRRVRQ